MAHKERSGWMPEEKKQGILTSTGPDNLGNSLLRAAVVNRTAEVVMNANPLSKADPEQKPINTKNLDWAFREFMKIQEDMIARG